MKNENFANKSERRNLTRYYSLQNINNKDVEIKVRNEKDSFRLPKLVPSIPIRKENDAINKFNDISVPDITKNTENERSNHNNLIDNKNDQKFKFIWGPNFNDTVPDGTVIHVNTDYLNRAL